MSARLTSQVLVSALIRRAGTQGGFGAVLARGDAMAGSILVVLATRGERQALLERLLQPDGDYAWQDIGRTADDEAFRALVERRRKFDPDLWIVELDVVDAERFAAEMNAAG